MDIHIVTISTRYGTDYELFTNEPSKNDLNSLKTKFAEQTDQDENDIEVYYEYSATPINNAKKNGE